MPSANDLDAVTVDAMGTVVELADPVPRLQDALSRRGEQHDPDPVRDAFAAEVAYYVPRAHEGRDPESLAALRVACAAVFLEALGAELDADEFAPAFAGALAFRPLDGAQRSLARLRAAGLALACVSNWDLSLAEYLEEAGLAHHFDTVVSSAEAGAPKPDEAVFRVALERLGVEPGRALHVGDGEGDRRGAAAAGLAFEPTPLATLPERLGIS
ncbi:MAG TPA: HAD-IA family hydrolase [Gaiellaceae bacterium]|jgi:putative hydrolase of the HAD superfamily|nr:HAD-IA family hydrolase [Gaiellaceae bacterium]